MEEAQYSEDLFSTQDDAVIQAADSVPVDVAIASAVENVVPSTSKTGGNGTRKEKCASEDQETPDLVFTEDIDFDKQSEKVSDSENIPDEAEAAAELAAEDELDQRIESDDQVVESSVPKPNADNAAASKDPPEERLAQFPFARIKQMMKLDPDVGIVTAEAIFLVTKAAELFLQNLAKDTSSHTLATKKKTMSKRDVELAIDSVDSLMFLEGMMNA
uniref:Transcription factor CBF/NF-Y/archaeal histone domain-containing protein n=1 Tax=Anopheles dirus TaxID=7168 RepID=A0A182N1Y0_9DIPT